MTLSGATDFIQTKELRELYKKIVFHRRLMYENVEKYKNELRKQAPSGMALIGEENNIDFYCHSDEYKELVLRGQ